MSEALVRTEPAAVAVAAPDPLLDVIARAATDPNTTIETLERLERLYERGQAREAKRLFAEALAAFQGECPAVRKDCTAKVASTKGAGFSYDYTSLQEIQMVTGPVLARHGLSCAFNMEATNKGAWVKVYCTVRHSAGHEETTTFEGPTESKGGMSEMQKVESADSIAKRRAMTSALGIKTGAEPNHLTNTGESASAEEYEALLALMEEVYPDVVRRADAVDRICARYRSEGLEGLTGANIEAITRMYDTRREREAG